MAKIKVKNGKKKAAATVAAADPKGRIGKTLGLKNGMGVSDSWNKLFRENIKAKKTDAQLTAAMAAEFPKRKKFQPVGRVRSFFNRGVQGYGNPPGENLRGSAKESFAYDAKGKKTDSTDWGQDHKPNKELSKLAAKRAKAVWKSKQEKAAKKAAKKPTSAGKPAAKKVKVAKKKAA